MSEDIFEEMAKSYLGSKTKAPSGKIAGYRPLTRTTGNKDYDQWYDEEGRKNDIDPNLLFAQGFQESTFNPKAVSSAGARGIAQFMGDTAKEFGVNPNDPRSSINGQARLMRQLIDRTNDIDLALAGYNSGHNASIDRLRRNKERIPETRDYVARIRKNYDKTPNIDPFEAMASQYLAQPVKPQSDPFESMAEQYLQGTSVPKPVTEKPETIGAQTPVPEKIETLDAQFAVAKDPANKARTSVFFPNDGTNRALQYADKLDAKQWGLFPDKKHNGLHLINLVKAKKLKLRTPQEIQNFIDKNPNALKTLGIVVEDVGNNTQGTAVVAKDADGNEFDAQIKELEGIGEAAKQGVKYAPTTAIPPTVHYTKRDTSKPGDYWNFETTGKAGNLDYLGMVGGKHVAKNLDGDTFEFDETAKTFKPTTPLMSKLKFQGGKQFTKKKDDIYVDENNDEYKVTATPDEKGGFTYISKPVNPFTKVVQLEDGTTLTRDAKIKDGFRYRDDEGELYSYTTKGIKQVNPPNWVNGKLDPNTVQLPEDRKALYEDFRKNHNLRDSGELRKDWLRRDRLVATGKQEEPYSQQELDRLDKIKNGAKIAQTQKAKLQDRAIARPAVTATQLVNAGGIPNVVPNQDFRSNTLKTDNGSSIKRVTDDPTFGVAPPEGFERYADDNGQTYLVDTNTGKLQDESLAEIADRFAVKKVPLNMKQSVPVEEAKKRLAMQVADQIGVKYDLDKNDVYNWILKKGVVDVGTDSQASENNLYQTKEDVQTAYRQSQAPSVGSANQPNSDGLDSTYSLTGRQLQDLLTEVPNQTKAKEKFALEKMAQGAISANPTKAELDDLGVNLERLRKNPGFYAAAEKGKQAQLNIERIADDLKQSGDFDDYTAPIKARANLGIIGQGVAQAEIDAYKKMKDEALASVKNPDGTLNPFDPNAWTLAFEKLITDPSNTTVSEDDLKRVVEANVEESIKQAGSATEAQRLREEGNKLSNLDKASRFAGSIAKTILKSPASFAKTIAWAEDTVDYLKSKGTIIPTLTSADLLNGIDWAISKTFGLPEKEKTKAGTLPMMYAKAVEDLFKDDPVTAQLASTKFANAIGSAVPFLVGATLSGGSTAAVAALGIGMQVGEMYDEAQRDGLSREKQLLSGALGIPIGASEVAGLNFGRLGALLNKKSGGTFGKYFLKWLLETGKEATEETIQEFLQSTAGDLVKTGMLKNGLTRQDVAKALGQSTGDAVTGGIVGALFGGGVPIAASTVGALTAPNTKARTDALLKTEPEPVKTVIEPEAPVETPKAKKTVEPKVETKVEPKVESKVAEETPVEVKEEVPAEEEAPRFKDGKREKVEKIDKQKYDTLDFEDEIPSQPAQVETKPLVQDQPTEVPVEGKTEVNQSKALRELGYTLPMQKKLSEAEKQEIVDKGIRRQDAEKKVGKTFIQENIDSPTLAQDVVKEFGGTLPSARQKIKAVKGETTKPRTVTVNDKQVTLTPEQEARWVKEVEEPLAKAKAQRDSDLKAAPRQRQAIEAEYKGKAMAISAIKREITGQLTGLEAKAKAKHEASNYIGKEVSVDGQNGKVIGNPFGRVKIEFADGTIKTVDRDKITAPITNPVKQDPIAELKRERVEAKAETQEEIDDQFIAGHKRERQRLMRRQQQANDAYAKNPNAETYRKLEEADKALKAFNATKWIGNETDFVTKPQPVESKEKVNAITYKVGDTVTTPNGKVKGTVESVKGDTLGVAWENAPVEGDITETTADKVKPVGESESPSTTESASLTTGTKVTYLGKEWTVTAEPNGKNVMLKDDAGNGKIAKIDKVTPVDQPMRQAITEDIYEQAKDDAGRIRGGSLEVRRLDSRGEQGRIKGGQRAVEASVLIGRDEAQRQEASQRGGSNVESRSDEPVEEPTVQTEATKDDALKRTPNKEDKASFENAESIPARQLIQDVDFNKNARVVEDGVVAVDEIREVELIRRLINEANGTRGGAFYGVFNSKKLTRKFLDTLMKKIKSANEKGIDTKQLKTLKMLVTNASKQDGTVIFAMDEAALTHEKVHRALNRYQTGTSKIAPDVQDAITNSPIFKKVSEGKWGRAYAHANPANKVEEFITAASTLDWDALGIKSEADKRAAMSNVIDYYNSYAETNKGEGTAEEVLNALATEIAYVKEITNQDQKVQADEGTASEADGDSSIKDAERKEDRPDVKTESQPVKLKKGEALASMPKTLRKYGLDAIDVAYTVYGHQESTDKAIELFKKHGIDGGIKFLSDVAFDDPAYTVLSGLIYDTLLNQSLNTQGQEAIDLRQKADNFLIDTSKRVARAGAIGEAVKIMQHAPVVTVVANSEAAVEARGGTLSPEQIKESTDLGRDLEDAFAERQFYKKDNDRLRKQLADLEKEMQAILSKQQKRTATRYRSTLARNVKEAHQDEIAKAASEAQAEIQRMVTRTDEPMLMAVGSNTDKLVEMLSKVTAGALVDGIANNADFLPETIQTYLETQYGTEVIAPIFQEVYAEGMKLRDKWIKEESQKRSRRIIENKLVDPDVKAAIEEQLKRPLPENLSDKDILDIMGVSRDNLRRQRALEQVHRYASGVRKSNVSPELRQVVADTAQDPITAVGAILHAEITSPKDFNKAMMELSDNKDIFPDGYSQKMVDKAFVDGQRVLSEAKELIKEHQLEIKQEKVALSARVRDAEIAEHNAKERLQHTKSEIIQHLYKLEHSAARYAAHRTWELLPDTLRNMTLSAEASYLMRQGGKFMRSDGLEWTLRLVRIMESVEQDTTTRSKLTPIRASLKTMLPKFKPVESIIGKYIAGDIGDDAFGRQILSIENDPDFDAAVADGVDFSTAGKIGSGLKLGEEQLQSEGLEILAKWSDKLYAKGKPIKGLLAKAPSGYAKGILRFDKAMAVFLDTLRLKHYKLASRQLRDQGMTRKDNRAEYKELAKRVNTGTSRPNKFENAKAVQSAVDAAVKSKLFLAPSYTVAKWQDLGADARNTVQSLARFATFQGLPKGTQRIMMRKAMQSYATLVGQYALLAYVVGALVSFDPDDDDFLRLKWGNYRYDLTQGNRSELKYIAKLIKHASDPTMALNSTTKYLRSRLNVLPAFAVDMWTGKDLAGQKVSPDDPARYAKLFAPLAYMNAIQAYQQDGAKGVLWTLPADVIGYQGSLYPDRVKDLTKQLSEAMKNGDVKEQERLKKELEKQRPIEQKKALEEKKDRVQTKLATFKNIDEAIASDTLKKWTTDDWVAVMKSNISEADKAKAAEVLWKKARNARSGRTLSQEEVDRIKEVLPNFNIKANDTKAPTTLESKLKK